MQIFQSKIRFTCPECKVENSMYIQVPEFNWSTAEDSSELYSEGSVEFECMKCNWPFSGYAMNNAGNCDITFDEYPETIIDADLAHFSEDPEDWTFYDVPADPYSIYLESYGQLVALLAKLGSSDGTDPINRMIFVQHISSLEAYLADTLIEKVGENKQVLLRLVDNDSDLRKIKFSLVDFLKNPDLVNHSVREFLLDINYHNLPRVNALYNVALNVSVLAKDIDHSHIFEAIKLRHDCVHRNGTNKEGKKLDGLNREYVEKTAEVIKRYADELQNLVFPQYF
jgi:hypothetical protein